MNNKIKKNAVIIHYPSELSSNPNSGSTIRPIKMIEGFKELGYEVIIISGRNKKRKMKIKKIKQMALNGVKFSFVYSESLTNPTLLSEPHHLPINPLLDYSFLYWAKKQNIPIGLFYRDIYWKSNSYKYSIPILKRLILLPFFWLDLFVYKLLVKILFVPSRELIQQYLYKQWPDDSWYLLPPGCTIYPLKGEKNILTSNSIIRLFYVGGVAPPHYDISILFDNIRNLDQVSLTVCCRRQEWEIVKHYYGLLSNNIKIVFDSGHKLNKHYNSTDIFILFRKHTSYNDVMMPVKIFESIGYGIPIITNSRTALANFVKKENLGWVIDSCDDLQNLINTIKNNPNEFLLKKNEVINKRNHFTWAVRAQKVVNVLTGNK